MVFSVGVFSGYCHFDNQPDDSTNTWLVLVAIFLVGILLINARTVFLGLALGLFIVMIASPSGKLRVSIGAFAY